MPKYTPFAYGLVFARFAHLRFIQTLTGRGEALILAQRWFGISSRAIVAVVVFLIGLPPIVAAYRVIANRRRLLVFLGSWLLPLPVLFLLLVGHAILFGSNGYIIHDRIIFGVPLIVLPTDLIMSTLFVVLKTKYLHLHEDA